MNPTKPNDTTSEQNTEQNTRQNATQGQQQPVAQPQPAYQRDVQRAENKAVEAQRMAAEEAENVRGDVAELREKNEELQETVELLVAALRHVDVHLTSVQENIGAWGNNYETEDIAEITDLPTIEELEMVEGYEPSKQEE